MDLKIMAFALLAVSLALVGVAFAMPGLHAMMGNWPGAGRNLSWQNATWHANATEMGQFRAAVMAGDYAAAKRLHDGYGLGGGLFGRLNETTFAQYSQIYNMSAALEKELGINQSRIFGAPRFRGFKAGFFHGMHKPGNITTAHKEAD